ncbi:MAG: HlyD family efflux transporter periplasmic adaptor subunit [Alphaproteobacteria bacterium]|nr:HlyD family efflux transporter periplasmic adaptor subunit [Alphaproteobacteria bacterium]
MNKLVLVAVALALLACEEKPKDRAYLGYVEGERVLVAAPDGGWIEEVFVAEGDQVSPGQKLFRLEARREAAQRDAAKARLDQAESQLANLLTGKRIDEIKAIEAQIVQAEANLGLARRERDRQQELAQSPAANPRLLDQARATFAASGARLAELQAQLRVARLPAREDEVAAARAQMDAAAAQLAEAEIRFADRVVPARAAGRVERLVRRAGELAPAGGTVASLLPAESIHVRIYVPEPEIAALRLGARLALACDGCAKDLTAQVTFVAGEAEFTPPVIYAIESRQKLVYLVKARPTAPGLKPGQPIEARPLP